MRIRSRLWQSVPGVFMLVLVTGMAGLAHAVEATGVAPSGDLRARYPQGGWTSLEQTDRALMDVAAERAQAEAEFSGRRSACYQRFFATACINVAQQDRRARLAVADTVEIEAERYRREVQAAQRARARAEAEAERAREEASNAASRAANARAYEQRLADHARREAERAQEERGR